MNWLSNQEIERIASDVAKANITLPHLQDELTDHICCEVEGIMEKGDSFEEAYTQVWAKAGIGVLQQIQEDTLILTDKYYALMKTTMKITGTMSLALIASGTLFRMLHLTGANIILVLGFGMLCLIFFPAAVFLDYARAEQKNLLKRITLLAGCTMLMCGILFKVMYWQGANMMLLLGWALMLGIFLPVFVVGKLRGATTSKEKGIYMLGAVALFIFELATLFKFFHWPGAGVLLFTGALLLIGCFLPLYTLVILKSKERSIPTFVFLIILSIYTLTMTALMSVNPKSPEPSTEQISTNPQ